MYLNKRKALVQEGLMLFYLSLSNCTKGKWGRIKHPNKENVLFILGGI